MKKGGKKEVPTWVKVISAYHYSLAVISIILGLFFSSDLFLGKDDALGMPFFSFFVIGFPLLATGAFSFFIGYGLWKLKSWAKTASVILNFLIAFLLLPAIFGMTVLSLPVFIISLIVAIYFLVNDNLKKIFD